MFYMNGTDVNYFLSNWLLPKPQEKKNHNVVKLVILEELPPMVLLLPLDP